MHADKAASLYRSGKALYDHLSSGGRIRRRLPSAVQRDAEPLLVSCTVDGRAPTDAADVEAVLVMLRARLATAELVQRWSHVGVRAATDDEPLPAVLSDLPISRMILSDSSRWERLGDDVSTACSATTASGSPSCRGPVAGTCSPGPSMRPGSCSMPDVAWRLSIRSRHGCHLPHPTIRQNCASCARPSAIGTPAVTSTRSLACALPPMSSASSSAATNCRPSSTTITHISRTSSPPLRPAPNGTADSLHGRRPGTG